MKLKLENYQKLLLKIPFIISSLYTEAKVTKLQTPSPQSPPPWVVGKGWSSSTPPTVACTGDLCSGFLGHFFALSYAPLNLFRNIIIFQNMEICGKKRAKAHVCTNLFRFLPRHTDEIEIEIGDPVYVQVDYLFDQV